MPVITSIKQQKNKDRVNVYLDDRFGFGIDLVNLAQLQLKVGQELTDKRVEEIVRKAEFQKTLDKLMRFATLRPRSEKEVSDYFKRKKIHESLTGDLITKLRHFDLLDDEKFAQWWVEQRQTFRPKSQRILRLELKVKGIDKETIEDVLGKNKVDEVKIARDLVAKKAYKWEGLSPRIRRQKISQYLAGKGYGWEVIEKVAGGVLE